MVMATITSKGQVTVPVQVRTDLHIATGDRIEFIKVAEGRYEIIAATLPISALRGVITSKKSVSVEEMNAAIKARAAKP